MYRYPPLPSAITKLCQERCTPPPDGAKSAKISAETMRKMMRGEPVTGVVIIKLAHSFGLTLEEFIRYVENFGDDAER